MPPAVPILTASLVLLLAGCASTATTVRPEASSLDCQAIRTEMAAARAARHAALDEQSDAWKGVLPPFVVSRYMSASGDVMAADDRISALQRHAFKQDCRAG